MHFNSPEIDDAIDVLLQRLPSRALATLISRGDYSDETLQLYEITDQTIIDLLIANRVDIGSVVADAASDIFDTLGVDQIKDPFGTLDTRMRDNQNPLLPHVSAIAGKLIGY